MPVAAWGDKLGEGPARSGCGHLIHLPSRMHSENHMSSTEPRVQLLTPPACLLLQLNRVLMAVLLLRSLRFQSPAPPCLDPAAHDPAAHGPEVPDFILNTLSPLTQPSCPPSPPSGFREPRLNDASSHPLDWPWHRCPQLLGKRPTLPLPPGRTKAD